MIRGPVLPQMREGLWALVARHLDSIETGLQLVLSDLDCTGGNLGLVDGLARDASGAPVLVLLAIDGDALLAARVLAAAEFLQRVGDSLGTAIPEASFATGVVGRVVVVGTEAASASLEYLRKLPLQTLEVCRLEPFRIAGTERFAVRWLGASAPAACSPSAAAEPAAVPFAVGKELEVHWQAIVRLCERLDAGVRIDGDRFLRRITWHGRLLGQVHLVDGCLQAGDASGMRCNLLSAQDVRQFGDRLVRRYAALTGLLATAPAEADATAAEPGRAREGALPGAAVRSPGAPGSETLRATLASVRLTAEEHTALGGPARMAGGGTEAAGIADDVVRIVAAQEGPWAGTSMRTD